jgi:hypothetical protein
MRKALVLLLIMTTMGVADAYAQRFEVTPNFGYRWGGKLSDGGYTEVGPYVVSLDFDSGPFYGLIAGYAIKPKLLIEGYWNRQHTALSVVNETLDESLSLGDGKIDYLQAGVSVLFFEPDIRLQPFFSFYLGATHIAPEEGGREGQWFSSVGYAIGVKYFFTDRIGARLQNSGMSTIVTDSESLFCAEGGEPCFTLPKDTWMWQIDLSLGLIVAF